MKKFKSFSLLTLVISSAIIFSHSVNADTIGVRASISQWTPSWDGNLGTGDLDGDMSLKDEDSTSFSLAFEHPVPVLPNIKIQSTSLSTKGDINSVFSYPGVTINGNEEIELVFDTQDAIFYWQALDNWVSLDLGLAARKYDAEFVLNNVPEVEESFVLPMLYGAARFDLPLSGFYGRGELLLISIDGSSIQDFQFGLGYESSIRLGAEVGLRSFGFTLDDVEDFDTDITSSGAYLALTFHL